MITADFTHKALLYPCHVMITHLQYAGLFHVSPGTKNTPQSRVKEGRDAEAHSL